jgi:hypothetical protein
VAGTLFCVAQDGDGGSQVVATVGSLPVGGRWCVAMPTMRGGQILPCGSRLEAATGWMATVALDGGQWRLWVAWEAVGASASPLPPPDLAAAGQAACGGVTMAHWMWPWGCCARGATWESLGLDCSPPPCGGARSWRSQIWRVCMVVAALVVRTRGGFGGNAVADGGFGGNVVADGAARWPRTVVAVRRDRLDGGQVGEADV